MARKDRNAVSEGLSQIFGSGGTDILRNVIENDRERGGRSPSPDVTRSEVANATSRDVGSATSSEVALPAQKDQKESSDVARHARAPRKQSSEKTDATRSEVANATSRDVGSATKHSDVESAILDLLDKPFLVDPKKGPFTVSTLKIPTAISERLGWVSSLTGKPKQEIVAEALKLYFETLSHSKKQENEH